VIKLDAALSGVTSLGLDTAPIIYFMEANPKYDDLVTEIFQRIDAGVIEGVTSVITLLEVLVMPLRSGDATLQLKYTDLLLHSLHLETHEITAKVVQRAADLRARYNLRTPDALQVAVVIEAGCQAFLTNDIALKRITELRVLVLDELELS
jgi:predicted nucleic acid-binding protein